MRARLRGYNYYLQGYIHDMNLVMRQDMVVQVTAKFWASQKKSEFHDLQMDINVHQKSIDEAYCGYQAGNLLC